MKHKTHHHKTFITLLILLLMGIGYLLGRNMQVGSEIEIMTLFVNTIFLLIITHFLLEIYSGNRVLEVVDVTPKEKPATPKSTTKKSTKKSSKKKATKKKSR